MIAYAVIDPLQVRRARSRASLPIVGSATLTIETSRIGHEERRADHRERLPATRIELGHLQFSLPCCRHTLRRKRSCRRAIFAAQWRKWRRPVKTIAAPAACDRRDDLVVALRAARLDERGDAGVERELRPVGEREERVAREHRAGRVVAELAGLLDRDPHGVDAAHLAGADADRLAALREHDRVRAHVLADAPGEQQVAPLLLVDGAGDDLHRLAVVDVESRSWTSRPPSTRL